MIIIVLNNAIADPTITAKHVKSRIACDSVLAPGEFDLWEPTTTLRVKFMEEVYQKENQLET
jgi:hypothetical protein